MKYLLSSGGVKNKSIHQELLRLLNKPIEDCHALCITTASYARANGARMSYEYINGLSSTPMCELGWKSIGNLELSALSQCDSEVLIEQASKADVFLVNGGDPLFLYYWMKQSGFDQLIPKLDAVYVGLSAGSMVMTPRIGSDFVDWNKHNMSDETCNLVPFSIFPHLNHVDLPDNNMENAQKWADEIKGECYAICDETAISVVGDDIKIISEGTWKKYPSKS
jgi:dipeptidase E